MTKSSAINQATGSTAGAPGTGTSETGYQSFTVGGADINVIAIRLNVASYISGGSMTIRLRTGEGTGGTLKGTAEAKSVSGTGDITFYFPYPITLTASTQYSLTMQSSGGEYYFSYANGTNPLANGRADVGSTSDYNFTIYTVDTIGKIGTSAGTNSQKVGVATASTALVSKNL